jgi:formylglycine-generating enzyme required for sulfatase activity
MGDNPSQFPAEDRPVERVSRDDCQAFIRRLNERMDGLGLALPSEVQWEYACRAGTESPRYREDLDEIAWFEGNSDRQTRPVARKAPNDWGLYDMLGNVWEWCADTWGSDYTHRSGKGAAAPASAPRVARGGSWISVSRIVRAAYRNLLKPAHQLNNLGFRCAEIRAPGPADRGRAAWLRPGKRAEESDSVPFSVLTPVRARTDLETLTIRPVARPGWATAIGRDRYGLWAEYTIDPPPSTKPRGRGLGTIFGRRPRAPTLASTPVRQRLRWIPPGRFLMGSPEDEEGRRSDEGPRHETMIDSGFWMFDTPCTQALWEAVMGEGTDPSSFRGADHPVEGVSWDDCQEFLKRLNVRLDGLHLSLPSEAQWEYACRAGTEAARYDADVDAIAWYDGNSAGKTHAVKGKAPNGWGLYDMLGNVLEWCTYPWTEDYGFRGGESLAAYDLRVVRGGSWGYDPRGVRAAYRNLSMPSNRDDDQGFRCAEFRSGS